MQPSTGGAAEIDAATARSLAAGDPRGLEDAYRRYADRLHAYCRSIVHDAAAASDAVHDTFVVASQRAGELRDPSRLRAWLYAIARNECLRLLRSQRRQAPLEAAPEMSAEPIDFAAGVRAEQLRELVHTASAGLSDRDREVIELALRHDLSTPDVAAVLGVSADHAHARLSRARTGLERSLGALLVARTGAGECAELGVLLAGWDGQLTSLLRKRLARHIDSCDICGERQRRQLQPSQLLAGFTALPFPLVAEELWPRIQLTCGSVAGVGVSAAVAARAGRFDPANGFPVPLDGARRRIPWAALAAAGVLLLVLGGAVLMFVPRQGTELVWGGPTTSPTPAVTDSGAPSPSSTPSASPTVAPTPSRSPAAPPPGPSTSPSPSASRPSPSTLVVTTRGTPTCSGRGWVLRTDAWVDGGTPELVVLHWHTETGAQDEAEMTWNGKSWQGSTGPLTFNDRIDQWWVSASTADGGRGQSASDTAAPPDCSIP